MYFNKLIKWQCEVIKRFIYDRTNKEHKGKRESGVRIDIKKTFFYT
ncbi:hypothetical protein EVA_04706 [gut metagenome]|uniref:Uncharacterized protein n=1 Tax=gut metagenome TaxID=749906 RepID=J9D3G3_9ZZZZ